MLCENIFCIYWFNKKCLLEEITLDMQGRCECCIYVDIDENILKEERYKILKKYGDI